jgi:hypothetical protein
MPAASWITKESKDLPARLGVVSTLEVPLKPRLD